MIKRMKFSKYVMTQTMQNSFSTKYRMYAKYNDPTTDTMEDVMRIRAATALAVIPATRERKLLPLRSHSPLPHKAKSLSTLIQTEGYSASLYYVKVCLKYHEFKMIDNSLFGGELLCSV